MFAVSNGKAILFVLLCSVFVLVGCGNNAQPQVPIAEPTAAPIDPATMGGNSIFAANFVAAQEQGGVTIDVARVIVGERDAVASAFHDVAEFMETASYDGDITIVEIVFLITNNTDEAVLVNPLDATLIAQEEKVELRTYRSTGASGDNIDEEILPGEVVTSVIWVGLADTIPADVEKMSLHIDPPRNSDFDKMGEAYLLEFNLPDHRWVPLPGE
jgi:uncharacterized lipoprotein NlpE involved in copper resistance